MMMTASESVRERDTLCQLRTATGNPNIDVAFWVILRFLEHEMCHWDRSLGRGAPVDRSHPPHVVELERADAEPDEETEDLGDKVEGGDGEGVSGEGVGCVLVGGDIVELPLLVVRR